MRSLLFTASALLAVQTAASGASVICSGTVLHSRSNLRVPEVQSGIKGASVTFKSADTVITAVTDNLGNYSFVYKPAVSIAPRRVNSAAGSLKISGEELTIQGIDAISVEIHDIRGRVLFKQMLAENQRTVSIPKFAEGVRLVTITQRTGETETVRWSGEGSRAFAAELPTAVSTVSLKTVQTNSSAKDTLIISAPGYDSRIKCISAGSGWEKDSLTLVNSSRGTAKDIQLVKYFRIPKIFGFSDLGSFTYPKQPSEGVFSVPDDTTEGKPYSTSYMLTAENAFTFISAKECRKDIEIDLDTVQDYTSSIFGTALISESEAPFFCYVPQCTVLLKRTDLQVIDTAVTDTLGRYRFANVPGGNYLVEFKSIELSPENAEQFSYSGNSYPVDTKVSRRVDHVGWSLYMTVAPNIYLYPETKSQISVHVKIRENGTIPFSIPEYGTGWSVSAAPDGRINDSLGFLYYDFISPVKYQSDSGWVLNFARFDTEIESLLSARGLNRQEIADFLDFWKRYIPACDWVVLCPADADRMVELTVRPEPASLFRELYLVIPVNGEKPVFKEPNRGTPFERKGFTVVEWGGHLEGLDLNDVIKDKREKR